MAKTLGKQRPKSTISDLIDSDLVQQATQPPTPEPPEVVVEKDKAQAAAVEQGAEQPAPATPSSFPTTPVSNPSPLPGVRGAGMRTGEHTDIEKMYRLTPTAQKTIQKLSMCLGMSLGFDVNKSVVIRAVLRAVHDALAEVEQAIEEQIVPQKQPSTAIGNEHARDALEQAIADAIKLGIQRHSPK